MLVAANRDHKLHYIVILHQTTTSKMVFSLCQRLHYIVILHQTTTVGYIQIQQIKLHYIVILHQTTTRKRVLPLPKSCIISLFYIKPQHISVFEYNVAGCIISLFYIKPQQIIFCQFFTPVALYRYSTSNHNQRV